MKYLSVDEIVAIHYELINVFGGAQGIHDFFLLHSAIERPKATFAGEDLYVSVFDKAAALMQSLITNHPFIDGNKRTAYVATARFLYINGSVITATKKEVIAYMLFIEKTKPGIKELSLWIEKNVSQ